MTARRRVWFVWYTHAGTLYVSRANEQNHAQHQRPPNNIAVCAKRRRTGVLDARFHWGEPPEQGLAMVRGHRAMQLIQATIQSLPAQANGAQQVAVLLRHVLQTHRTAAWRDR